MGASEQVGKFREDSPGRLRVVVVQEDLKAAK